MGGEASLTSPPPRVPARLPTDTERGYTALVTFAGLPRPRTWAAAGRALGVHKSAVQRMAARGNWQARLEALDAAVDAQNADVAAARRARIAAKADLAVDLALDGVLARVRRGEPMRRCDRDTIRLAIKLNPPIERHAVAVQADVRATALDSLADGVQRLYDAPQTPAQRDAIRQLADVFPGGDEPEH